MNEKQARVTVAKDLVDLIPIFLRNRHKEVDALRMALAAADFKQLRQIGHRMVGVGYPYGFERVSLIGEQILNGARSEDPSSLAACITEYGNYLSKVQIAFE
jgi:hypothetical protein